MTQQNSFNTKITLKDILEQHKKDIMLSINCHAIATVTAFNSTNQTVQCSMNYTKTYFQKPLPSAKTQSSFYVEENVDYPVMVDCPVVIMSGGTANLTFPIKKGDQCLIMFNDRSIDNWFENGQKTTLNSSRLHSFTDAIALIGLKSLKNSITNYDTARIVLKNKNAKIAIDEDKIEISNSTRNLNTILQNLITAIQAITVTGVTTGGGTSGPPANVATFTTIATQLGQLIE